MYEDLVLLLMGVMVVAMIMAVVIVQSRLSRGKSIEEVQPVEDKVYVEMGFEPEEETETLPPEPVDDSVEFNLEPEYDSEEELPSLEHDEVFYDTSFDSSEPVVIETPQVVIQGPEPVKEEEPVKPMFEVSYEPSEPVVIEAPEMIVIDETETGEFKVEKDPMFEVPYQGSEPVVIETERLILESEEISESIPEETVELQPDEVSEPETQIELSEPEEELVVELEVEEVGASEPKLRVEETSEVAEEPEEVETVEAPIPRQRRKMRKPIIDESDPSINLDMGVKKCPHCDSEVPDTIYCISCGKSLNPESVEA